MLNNDARVERGVPYRPELIDVANAEERGGRARPPRGV